VHLVATYIHTHNTHTHTHNTHTQHTHTRKHTHARTQARRGRGVLQSQSQRRMRKTRRDKGRAPKLSPLLITAESTYPTLLPQKVHVKWCACVNECACEFELLAPA